MRKQYNETIQHFSISLILGNVRETSKSRLSSRSKVLVIADKKYAKLDLKVFCSCQILLDFFALLIFSAIEYKYEKNMVNDYYLIILYIAIVNGNSK